MRTVLIGGSSHVGKTAVGTLIAEKLGGKHLSTDKLARHPGRPWDTPTWTVPEHVKEYYANDNAAWLLADVLGHYRQNVLPLVQDLLSQDRGEPLVLEGSAIWPEFEVSGVWLTADDDLFRDRMYLDSSYEAADAQGRRLIDNFLKRTLLYNRAMMDVVRKRGLPHVVVDEAMSVEQVAESVLERCSMSF